MKGSQKTRSRKVLRLGAILILPRPCRNPCNLPRLNRNGDGNFERFDAYFRGRIESSAQLF